MARGLHKLVLAGALAGTLAGGALPAQGAHAYEQIPVYDRPVRELPPPGLRVQSAGYAIGAGLGVASLTALLFAAAADRELREAYGQIDGHAAMVQQRRINNISYASIWLGSFAVATLTAAYFEPRWMPYFSKDSVGVAVRWGAP